MHSNPQSYSIITYHANRYRAFVLNSSCRVKACLAQWQHMTKLRGWSWPYCSGWVPLECSCWHHCVIAASSPLLASCSAAAAGGRTQQLPLLKKSHSKALRRSKIRSFPCSRFPMQAVPRVSLVSQCLQKIISHLCALLEVPPVTLFSF